MAKLTVNIGTSANDRTGDNLRTAFNKINENFDELYTALGLDDNSLNLGAFEFTGSVMTTTDSSAITIDQAVTVSSDLTVGGDVVPSTDLGGNLGSATKQWKSLYVSSNTIFIGGTAIGVNASGELSVDGTLVSNVNNDYNQLTNAPTNLSDFNNDVGFITAETDSQTLSISGKDISISDGNTISLSNFIEQGETFTGDILGSVYSDDSTRLVDGTSGVINLNFTSINSLLDVDTVSTAPTSGQVLKWDGSKWAPADDTGSAGGFSTDADTLDGFDSSYFLNYTNLNNKPTLGTAAATASTDYATAAQGTKADTAYGWGDHSAVGYLTSYTETDTLQIVATRGNDFTGYLQARGLDANNGANGIPKVLGGAIDYELRVGNDGATANQVFYVEDLATLGTGTHEIANIHFAADTGQTRFYGGIQFRVDTDTGQGKGEIGLQVQDPDVSAGGQVGIEILKLDTTGATILAGKRLYGDVTGSVFADDSTLLVDAVSGTIPWSVISGAPVSFDGDYDNLTNKPIDTVPTQTWLHTTDNRLIVGPGTWNGGGYTGLVFDYISGTGDCKISVDNGANTDLLVDVDQGNIELQTNAVGTDITLDCGTSGRINVQGEVLFKGVYSGSLIADTVFGGENYNIIELTPTGNYKLGLDDAEAGSFKTIVNESDTYTISVYRATNSVLFTDANMFVVDIPPGGSAVLVCGPTGGNTNDWEIASLYKPDTGNLTTDIQGSVYGDDSTVLVDGVNNQIPYSVIANSPIRSYGHVDVSSPVTATGNFNTGTLASPSTGIFNITFATPLEDANYTVLLTSEGESPSSTAVVMSYDNRTVNGFTVYTWRITDGQYGVLNQNFSFMVLKP